MLVPGRDAARPADRDWGRLRPPGVEFSRFLCDDGPPASCRAGAGKSPEICGVDGRSTTGLDAGSRMRQEARVQWSKRAESGAQLAWGGKAREVCWRTMCDPVPFPTIARPIRQRTLLMHVSAVSASNCSGVGDKCSRKTSPNSSVGYTSNPCARKLRATAWRTSSVSTIACLACLTAPETDAETFPTHAHFALDGLLALTARPERLLRMSNQIDG